MFCQLGKDQLTHLCWMLKWFEASFGLKINLEKSEMILMGRVENIEELAAAFGC